MVDYYKAANYVNNQVAVPFINVLCSASANGFCGQFVETSHQKLLCSYSGAENKVCDGGGGGRVKGSVAECK